MRAEEYHRIAYEHDVRGENPRLVDEHYRNALALDGSNAERWMHFVCFLLTRARFAAAQIEWANALIALGTPDAAVVNTLHVHVASLAIHCGKYKFAQEILASIQEPLRPLTTGLVAMERHCRTMLEVSRHNDCVFPLTVPIETWWDGPHLHDKPVTRWVPGHVQAVDEDGVHLFAAIPPTDGGEPQYGYLTIPIASFDIWSLNEKAAELTDERFVELAWRTDSDTEEPTIRVHENGPWVSDLPPPLLDSVRYLRRDGWVRP